MEFLRAVSGSNKTQWFRAIRNGVIASVHELSSKVDVNVQDNGGKSALMIAAENGQETILNFLLTRPEININLQCNEGLTALMWASLNGQEHIVKILLAIPNINVNAQSSIGETALTLAAHWGSEHVVKLLVEAPGIKLDLPDPKEFENRHIAWDRYKKYQDINRTLIHPRVMMLRDKAFEAIKQNDKNSFSVVIPQLPDHFIDIFIDKAFTLRKTEIIFFLLQHLDDPRESLARFPFESLNPSSALFKYFFDLAYCTESNSTKETPKKTGIFSTQAATYKKEWFETIAKFDDLETIKKLLSKVDINTQDSAGNTALMLKSDTGPSYVLKFLLTVPGIDVNIQNKQGQTALIIAAESGHEYLVKILLEAPDINVNLQDARGRSAFNQALLTNLNIAKMLANMPGINVNAQDEAGCNSLTNAAFAGNEKAVKFLLTIPEIDVNHAQFNNGRNALQWAAVMGHENIVRFLLQAPNINLNAQDNWGETALMLAAQEGHDSIAKLLLDATSIKINIQDKTGKTALMHATYTKNHWIGLRQKKCEVIETLIKNKMGQLMFCQVCGHEAIKYCAGCKKVYYCSDKCQKADWKNHKKFCNKSTGL